MIYTENQARHLQKFYAEHGNPRTQREKLSALQTSIGFGDFNGTQHLPRKVRAEVELQLAEHTYLFESECPA